MKQLVFAALFLTHISLFGAAQKAVTKQDVLQAKGVHKKELVAYLQTKHSFPKPIAQIVMAYDAWSLGHVLHLGFEVQNFIEHRLQLMRKWKENDSHKLVLGRDNIYTLDTSGLGLESIEGLDCCLQRYPFADFDALDLSNNQLTVIDSSLQNALKKFSLIDLSNNRLTRLPYVAWEQAWRRGMYLEGLTHMILAGNVGLKITEPLSYSLQVLDVSNCGITQIAGAHVKDLDNLRILVLEGNEISELPTELSRLRSLLHVYAEQNRLSSPQSLSHATIHSANQKTTTK